MVPTTNSHVYAKSCTVIPHCRSVHLIIDRVNAMKKHRALSEKERSYEDECSTMDELGWKDRLTLTYHEIAQRREIFPKHETNTFQSMQDISFGFILRCNKAMKLHRA